MIKKRGRRIAGIAIIGLILVYIVFAIVFSGEPEAAGNTTNVYFLNPSTNELVAEKRPLEDMDYANAASEVYEMLIYGPITPGLAKVYPDPNLESYLGIIRQGNTDIRNIEVRFTSDYYNLAPAEEITLRSAIVWTLTELEWVNEVIVMVDGVELLRSDGGAVGPMTQENVYLNSKRPLTQEKAITKAVTLYFADKDMTGLVAERRVITVPSDLTEERVVLSELLNGPAKEGLISLIPSDTVINDVSTQDGICYVDLNPSFDTRLLPGTVARKLAVYSIVNTLTEMSSGNVRKVQFYLNAERPASKDLEVDLSNTFENDESVRVVPKDDDF